MAYLTPDKETVINGVTIKQYFLTDHNPNRISLPVKRTAPLIGVTLHNTDSISVSSATTMAEQYTRATVNGNMNDVRVHFYVDDKGAWQNLPLDYQSWHAGHRGRADAHGSEKGNAQTISIECIMSGKGDDADLRARDNAARLVAYLLDTYGGELYTHNYWENIRNGWTGTVDVLNRRDDGYKCCPVFIRPKWNEFKKLVAGYRGKNASVATDNNVGDKMYYVMQQLGAYKDKANAEKALATYKSKYPDKVFKIV